MSWLTAFALTVLIEVPVWTLVLRRSGTTSLRRAVGIGVAVNVISHPTLWFVLVPVLRYRTGDHDLAVIVAEIIVWCGEAAFARALLPPSRRRTTIAVAAAVAANATSFGLGLLLTRP